MKKFLTLLITGYFALCLLAGCGENSGDTNRSTFLDGHGSTPEVILTGIQVTPGLISISKGTTTQFTATGFYSDNSIMDLTGEVNWSSSSPQFATISNAGRATGVTGGVTTITASSGPLRGTATLTVINAVLSDLKITPTDQTIDMGTSIQYNATGVYVDPNTHETTFQPVTDLVTWSTNPADIATIAATGMATGIAIGNTFITATLGEIVVSTTLTVTDTELMSISVTPADQVAKIHDQVQYTATGTYADGHTQVFATGDITWGTNPEGIATIAQTGLATAAAVGNTLVTAVKDTIVGSTPLTVTEAELMSIAVAPANDTIGINGTRQYTATGTYSDGKTSVLPAAQVSWSTNPTGFATIGNNITGQTPGLATGVKAGSTFITAAKGDIYGSTPLTVKEGGGIPTPPPADPAYFQVMFDNRVTDHAEDKIHLFIQAAELKLNSPIIYNATWLTGGGAKFDDWTKPVFQVVTKATGNDNVAFAANHEVTLDKLPRDATTGMRILKIPFLKPGTTDTSLGGSGRIYISFDNAVWTQINPAVHTKINESDWAIGGPSQDLNGAGGKTRFDKIEFNCATPAVGGKSVCFMNTTNVDFFSLGFTFKGRSANDTISKPQGLNLNIQNPCASTVAALRAIGGDYAAGYLEFPAGTFLRFLALNLANKNATALDKGINDGYEHYRSPSSPLVFNIGTKQYSAFTNGPNVPNPFVYLDFGADGILPLPSTYQVIACAVGNWPPGNMVEPGKYVGAYLNRGVLNNISVWKDPTKWYPIGVQHNEYSHVLHTKFLDGLVYGFSFDDVPGDPVDTVPTGSTSTSMTLVLTD